MKGKQEHKALFAYKWRGPAIALMDLDAFFASVEQLDHPEWRKKPVIVGGSAEKRGVVATASYEARKYGIHSAMSSAQAQRLCPHAIWTKGNFERYKEVSQEVMNILIKETPLVEQVSIDEAFFDITPGRWSNENPIFICKRIQQAVLDLGVSCSIGLGSTKTLAKIASEEDKPCGLTVILPGSEQQFLSPLPVKKMSGVGSATEKILFRLGIYTIGDLAAAPTDILQKHLGVQGPRLKIRACAKESSAVRAYNAHNTIKSLSSEHTFEKDLLDKNQIYAAIANLSAHVALRLRQKNLKAGEIGLKIKYDFNHMRSVRMQLAEPSQNEHIFISSAQKLLDRIWIPGQPVRLLGITLSGFDTKVARQLTLFDTDLSGSVDMADKKEQNFERLATTTDTLKNKFGIDAIKYGRELMLKN